MQRIDSTKDIRMCHAKANRCVAPMKSHAMPREFLVAKVLKFASMIANCPSICLDTYMPGGVYQDSGICIRNHCRAEPPRDIGPPGLVTTVGGRDRASASYAAAYGVKAPAGAARRRFRGVHGGRTAPSLPAEARTTSGAGYVAGSVPPVLVGSRRCPRTPPRPPPRRSEHGPTGEDLSVHHSKPQLDLPKGPGAGRQQHKQKGRRSNAAKPANAT